MKRSNLIKKLVLIVIVISIVFGILITNYNRGQILTDIERYVNDNYEDLEKVAINYINNQKDSYPKHISKIEVNEAVNNQDTIVQFTYKSNNKTEYGFYYSMADKAVAYKNSNFDLLELGRDKWMWDGDDGSSGVTSKIRPSWYYYKVKK